MTSLSVEHLGKRYSIPQAQEKNEATRSRFDRIASFFSIPLARELRGGRELWALQDVSFNVEPGTVLGIVGSNGAGKSTLLKVIARVISPTTGRVSGRGRVVSLLELGAGFDDESSARENIFMNAALNGIPRAVVQKRFDDIIAFAEIKDFVDTPLQYFSSGMYLRLAFSVAINMDPSILLADEILAVGDLAFQERCLRKVHEMAQQTGLTVLFVSHDMDAISRICDRVVWLKDGLLHADGAPDAVIERYQSTAWETLMSDAGGSQDGGGRSNRYGEILDVKLLSADGREIGAPPRAEDVFVRIRFRTRGAKVRGQCSVDLHTRGVLVLRSAQPQLVALAADTAYEALVRVPANLLSETAYTISAGVMLIRGEGEQYPLVASRALNFIVYGDGAETAAVQRKGVVNPTFEWSLETEPDVVRA